MKTKSHFILKFFKLLRNLLYAFGILIIKSFSIKQRLLRYIKGLAAQTRGEGKAMIITAIPE